MNYRHLYHAGSFTDVFKHIVLTGLIVSLQRKETPFCYIDTHAGIGYYDLFSASANKTKEYESGIEKIIAKENPPPLIKRYLDCVHHINNELTHTKFSSLRFYPGSPMIARTLARAQDKIIACELHPEDYAELKHNFLGDKQVAIHHSDGFLSLKAFLPPKERRGLVLIDPPYEDVDEFKRIVHTLPMALKRWESGIFAIWYPIKEKSQVDKFYRTIKETLHAPVLAIELTTYPDLPQHLNGSGMVIVNPPWQFDTQMGEILPWVWNALTINNQGTHQTFWLK